MIRRRALSFLAALLLAGCTPLGEGILPPSPSPATSPSPRPSDKLPTTFVVNGPLTEGTNAKHVVSALHHVAENYPVLKLDVTATSATLTALDPQQKVINYRWEDNKIDRTISDYAFFNQATFDPRDFPLENISAMFDTADLLGVRGSLVYQIQQYRDLLVVQSVSSRPETKTVFFQRNGAAVAQLGTTSAQDIIQGLTTVIGDAPELLEVGFSPSRGYWAEFEQGNIRRIRHRTANLPLFRLASFSLEAKDPFQANTIDPAIIAAAVERYRGNGSCEVMIRRSEDEPVAQLTCPEGTHRIRLDGAELPG